MPPTKSYLRPSLLYHIPTESLRHGKTWTYLISHIVGNASDDIKRPIDFTFRSEKTMTSFGGSIIQWSKFVEVSTVKKVEKPSKDESWVMCTVVAGHGRVVFLGS